MIKFFTFFYVFLFFHLQLIGQKCSGGGAISQVTLNFSGLLANGDIGEPENSKGKVCFTGGKEMAVVGDIVSNLQITTSNGSWCSEANVRFGNISGGAGGWQFDQLFSPDNTGPCGTVNNPLDDYTSSGTPIFKTDSTGCIHYQVFDLLNDSINKQEFKFDAGSISFFGCPIGQVLIPSIQITQISETVCSKDSFIVAATAPLADKISWYVDQISGAPGGSGFGLLKLIITSAGAHKIYAIATNSNGSDTTSFTIQVIVPAKSAFNVNILNLTASFKNLSTDGVNYLWNFGDGNTSTDFEPTHTYNVQGTYAVALTVTNKCGSIISDTTKITLITSSSSNPSWVNKAVLYPNPVNDLLFFDLTSNLSTGTLPVKIWSIDGELVHTTNWQVNSDSQLHKLSIEHLKAGVYALVLHSEKGNLVQKFIKE